MVRPPVLEANPASRWRALAGRLRSEWCGVPRRLRVLVVAQVVFLLGITAFVAYKYPAWSPIDEGAHFSYVQTVATEHRLPVLGRDPAAPEVLAIGSGTYPDPSPPVGGLAAQSYEAFQPPLYYAVVAPLWRLGSDTPDQVRWVRMAGVVFTALTVLVLAALAREVVGDDWPVACSFLLMVLTLPGLVFREALVGNGALAPLLVTTFVLVAVRAWRRARPGLVVLAGFVAGLCLLDRLIEGYVVVPFVALAVGVWWRRGHRGRDLGWVVVAGLVPVVMLAPWLLHNRSTYGAWTASSLAREMQIGIVNPTGSVFSFGDALFALPKLSWLSTPSEFFDFVSARPPASVVYQVLDVVLFPLSIVLMAVFARRVFTRVATVWCVVPFAAAAVALVLSSVVGNWPQMLARYTFGAVPSFAVVVYVTWRVLIPERRSWSVFSAVWTAATAAATVALLWIAFVDNVYYLP